MIVDWGSSGRNWSHLGIAWTHFHRPMGTYSSFFSVLTSAFCYQTVLLSLLALIGTFHIYLYLFPYFFSFASSFFVVFWLQGDFLCLFKVFLIFVCNYFFLSNFPLLSLSLCVCVSISVAPSLILSHSPFLSIPFSFSPLSSILTFPSYSRYFLTLLHSYFARFLLYNL